MSKRILILTTEVQTILNGKNEEKYMKYAREHNSEIIGEMHYPPVMSFVAPEKIVEAVKQVNPEIVIANDVDFIIANAYHDGRFVKMFEENGISVINSEMTLNISDFNKIIDDDMLEKMKESIHYAIEETVKENKKRIAIITKDSSRDEFMDFVKQLSEESEKICIIEMPTFDPKTCKHIDFCIKDSDINKVIVYDDELITQSMEQYLFKLQTINHIAIRFKEDYDIANNQSLKPQGMTLN